MWSVYGSGRDGPISEHPVRPCGGTVTRKRAGLTSAEVGSAGFVVSRARLCRAHVVPETCWAALACAVLTLRWSRADLCGVGSAGLAAGRARVSRAHVTRGECVAGSEFAIATCTGGDTCRGPHRVRTVIRRTPGGAPPV